MMKKMVLLTLMSLMILSCNKDETGLTGEWKLVAQLMDPGDGSGVVCQAGVSRCVDGRPGRCLRDFGASAL